MNLTKLQGDVAVACLSDARSVIATQKTVHEHHFECFLSSGKKRMISLTASPLRDANEEFDGVVVVIRDITIGVPETNRSELKGFHGFVGASSAMLEVYALIQNVSKVDVRVVAATNVDLQEKVNSGGFREDVYYRLKVIEIVLPPLRQRLSSIPIFVRYFISYFVENTVYPCIRFQTRQWKHSSHIPGQATQGNFVTLLKEAVSCAVEEPYKSNIFQTRSLSRKWKISPTQKTGILFQKKSGRPSPPYHLYMSKNYFSKPLNGWAGINQRQPVCSGSTEVLYTESLNDIMFPSTDRDIL